MHALKVGERDDLNVTIFTSCDTLYRSTSLLNIPWTRTIMPSLSMSVLFKFACHHWNVPIDVLDINFKSSAGVEIKKWARLTRGKIYY